MADAREAADAAARGVRDVAATLRERLSNAPRLTSVTAAQAKIESGESALARADAELQAAVAAIGGAIAAAAKQQELVAAGQKTHRFDAPVDLLIKETFRDLPLHLTASFTKDYHRGFNYDQTSAWQNWKPSDPPVGLTSPGQPGFLMRWGSWQAKSEIPLMFSALPLIGGGRPWVIVSGGDDASIGAAHDLMRALALRIACTLPQQSRFTFLDPLGYGQTFPLQRYLPNVRETGADLAQDLQRIQSDVRRIIKDVVAFEPSFESLPAEVQVAERFEFIIAADFPKATAYDRRVSDMLFDIGRAGPKAGRYLILHIIDGVDLPHGLSRVDLGPTHTITLKNVSLHAVDKPPAPELQQQLLERVRGAVPTRRSAQLADILPAHADWWTSSAARRVETTLDGRKDGLQVLFGQRDDGTELVHGVLAASAGAGKSNLLHAMLLGLATRYAPDELQLYLMDLKMGVEFKAYASLPHAAVVAYNTAPALARDVLAELKREMSRRYEKLFRPSDVQKLDEYRSAGSPLGPAPRILLVIDEYQALFSDGDTQEVSANLRELSSQGRAAGIHMLLGSQTFRASGMQSADQIFNNINVRMAMQLPAAAVQAMSEFEREGRDMIRELSGAGTVILNTGAGRDGANKRGQVVLVEPAARADVLESMVVKAKSWPAERRASWPRTQVFDGSRAPSLASHSLSVLGGTAPLDTASVAAWAVREKSAGGLGRTDWRASDRPLPLLLGREFAVHGDAACVLRRLPNQNLLIAASSAPARLGLLGGILASCGALAPEVIGRVRVLDLSGDPQVARVLATFANRATIITDAGAAVPTIEDSGDDAGDLLILVEPDRAVSLMRPSDPLARAAGPEALERRLREGPLSGRHTVFVCNGTAAIGRVLGRRGAGVFAWRAVTQMSQEDSQDLLGNRQAAQLREDDSSRPEPVLLADVEGNRFTRFMAWAV
ncbi:MAG: hypothetical protein H7099_19135 [Gemmatimonadaceae bacterium]|nr:hypothetical protein [Gemmatimonadaceae bacterium]